MRRPGVSIIVSAVFGGVVLGLKAAPSPRNHQFAAAKWCRSRVSVPAWCCDTQSAGGPASRVSSFQAQTKSPRSQKLCRRRRLRAAPSWRCGKAQPAQRATCWMFPTSSSFTSYVDGYHDLDVGNATGRVVTGLNPGHHLIITGYGLMRPLVPVTIQR